MNTIPTRAERKFARVNDPRYDRYRSTPVRRRLVVAMALCIILEGATIGSGQWLHGPVYSGVAFLVFLVAALGFFAGWWLLRATTRGVEELAEHQLDERQLQIRGQVYARAYRILAASVFVLIAAGTVWWNVAGTTPSAALGSGVLLLVLHGTLALPTLVAAWHERV